MAGNQIVTAKKRNNAGRCSFFEAPNTYGLTKFKLMLKYNGLLN